MSISCPYGDVMVRERVPGSSLQVGGDDVFVRETGQGAPALFVHGLGGQLVQLDRPDVDAQ